MKYFYDEAQAYCDRMEQACYDEDQDWELENVSSTS